MTNKMNSKSSKVWYPLLFAGFTALGMLVGFRMAGERSGEEMSFVKKFSGEENGKIGRLEELLRFIDAKYVDDVDDEKLIDAATEAIFNELDPHSVYIPPSDIERINQRMSGYYKGVGIETILFEDTLRVTRVMENSPAMESGLEYGDKIISLQDTVVAGVNMPVEKQWSFLKVEKGEVLKMQLLTRSNASKEAKVIPEQIQYPNVQHFYIGKNAYINIEKFSDDTYEELVKALESFQKDKIIPSLIIDLRNNPGGYLQEATKILNQLFEEDKRLLVYTKGKTKKSEYNTTGRPFYRVEKLAILINRNSASASEIIAGAVQDWDQGIIVGEQSYGKGLVQDQFDLNNGGSIRLTTARYFTPTGRYIQTPYSIDKLNDTTAYKSKTLNRPLIAQGGITPDYLVEESDQIMETKELVRRTIVSSAYNFIIDNNLLKGQAPNFDSPEMQAYSENRVLEFAKEYDLKGEETEDLYSRLLHHEVLKQLGLVDEARQLKYGQDPTILKAQDILNFENIFADFVKD